MSSMHSQPGTWHDVATTLFAYRETTGIDSQRKDTPQKNATKNDGQYFRVYEVLSQTVSVSPTRDVLSDRRAWHTPMQQPNKTRCHRVERTRRNHQTHAATSAFGSRFFYD